MNIMSNDIFRKVIAPMFFLIDTNDNRFCFNKIEELKDYIETRHAEEGGFDWVSEIKDSKGNFYGCNWNVEIE